MARARYSDSDVARLATRDYKSLDPYQKRLVRGHNKGLSRDQSRGHPNRKAGEKSATQVQRAQAKQSSTPARPAPTMGKSQKSGKPKLGRHIQHQYNEKGERTRTRINARSTASLEGPLKRIGSNEGVIIHLVTKDGKVIKAVGSGRNHTANAGDLQKKIADLMGKGLSANDAFFGSVIDAFDLYDEDGNYVNAADLDASNVTNIIVYSEAA